MTYAHATWTDVDYELKDGSEFRDCTFSRVVFRGLTPIAPGQSPESAKQILFHDCSFLHSRFKTLLVESAVSGCTFRNTDLQVGQRSLVSNNCFYGDSRVCVYGPEPTLGQRVLYILARIPVLRWVFSWWIRRLSCGALIAGNIMGVTKEATE